MSRQRELLSLLGDGRVHSGEQLAASLSISRAAVWKRLQRLADWQVDVEAQPGAGYRLVAPLDLLDASRIRAALPQHAADRLRTLEVHDTLASTSDRLLASGEPPPGRFDACLAEFQTAGRGRRGRQWMAPFGSGLCLSVSWCYRDTPATLGALSLAAGVAVLRALRQSGFGHLSLKWPNDIVHDAKKLGGILIDLRGEAAGPAHVVVGVGINVRLPAATIAALAADGVEAVDLAALGSPPSRNAAAAALIGTLSLAIEEFGARGMRAFAQEWESADVLAGRPVRVHCAGAPLDGVACGVDADGALLLDVGGARQRVVSGEVSVRPVR